MNFASWRPLLLLSVFVALSPTLSAKDLEVSDAWIRVLPAGAPAGGYFTLTNGTSKPVELVGASSTAYSSVMMHRTVDERGLTKMISVDRVTVPGGASIGFAPGTYHLMLMNPRQAIRLGDRIAITLEFADKRKITTPFEAKGPAGK